LSYGDFSDGMQSPTCIMYLSMMPYEGYTIVEVNHALLAPILDYVLGGNGKISTELEREITEIEKGMLEGFFRIIPRELTEAWKIVVPIKFAFDCVETEPQLSNRIARDEAVVAIAMELRLGDRVGTVNLAIPSITLKMLRHRFDQQSTTRKSGSSETEAAIKQRLSEALTVDVDCAVTGSGIRLKDLLNLQAGHLLNVGIPCDHRATLLVNGARKFVGEIIALETHKQALVIESFDLGQ
jgi:flagellar motor switch protein FliM